MSDQLTSRRAPSAYALALVVLLTAAGMLLRWWGPINPSIHVGMSNDGNAVTGYGGEVLQTDWQVNGTANVTLNISNGSHSAVTIGEVRAVPTPDTIGLPMPSLDVHEHPKRLSPTDSVDIDVTVVAAPACAAWLAQERDDWQTPRPGEAHVRPWRTFSLVTDLRTTSGRIKTVGRNIRLGDVCPTQAFLPPPGKQPADPTAAKHAVTVAFWSAYDTRNALKERGAFIDDVTGIPRLLPGGIRSQVHDVVFTSPTSASVVYDVYFNGVILSGDQLGHARLVDGTWKVTRGTVCRDVKLANQRCD